MFAGHFQDVADGLAFVVDFQGFAVVALAVTDFAGHIDIRQKVHFDLDDAVTGTVFAAAAFDVEAETAGAVAAQFGFGHLGKQFADRREQAGVGRRVGARRAANRRLVDDDGFVELLDAFDVVVAARHGAGPVQAGQQFFGQNVVDQAGFAGAGDAADHHQLAKRNLDVDILQIILAGTFDDQCLAVAIAALFRRGNMSFCRIGTRP